MRLCNYSAQGYINLEYAGTVRDLPPHSSNPYDRQLSQKQLRTHALRSAAWHGSGAARVQSRVQIIKLQMERGIFHKRLNTGGAPAVFPVIHVQDFNQAKRNVIVALRQGAQGVFLINHDFPSGVLIPIIKQIRTAFPYLWLGVNFLGVTGTCKTVGLLS